MKDPKKEETIFTDDDSGGVLYKRDFWCRENLKYSRPHHRLKSPHGSSTGSPGAASAGSWPLNTSSARPAGRAARRGAGYALCVI
jgi:hypothetical protein